MTSQATITGRVVGPDGLGRMGRLRLRPTALSSPLPAREIVAGRRSARIDPDGRLVTADGGPLTVRPGNYEIDLNIPGDLGAHIRTTRYLSEGQTLDIADLLSDVPAPPPTPNPPSPGRHGVRSVDNATTLEAINQSEVIDLGNGVLTWR